MEISLGLMQNINKRKKASLAGMTIQRIRGGKSRIHRGIVRPTKSNIMKSAWLIKCQYFGVRKLIFTYNHNDLKPIWRKFWIRMRSWYKSGDARKQGQSKKEYKENCNCMFPNFLEDCQVIYSLRTISKQWCQFWFLEETELIYLSEESTLTFDVVGKVSLEESGWMDNLTYIEKHNNEDIKPVHIMLWYGKTNQYPVWNHTNKQDERSNDEENCCTRSNSL